MTKKFWALSRATKGLTEGHATIQLSMQECKQCCKFKHLKHGASGCIHRLRNVIQKRNRIQMTCGETHNFTAIVVVLWSPQETYKIMKMIPANCGQTHIDMQAIIACVTSCGLCSSSGATKDHIGVAITQEMCYNPYKRNAVTNRSNPCKSDRKGS